MVKRWFLVGVMLLLASLLVAGCGVPQEDYDAVLAERDAAQAQVASLQSDMSETQSQIETLESDLADAQAQLTTVQSDYDKVNSDLAKTQDEIDALEILILALSGSLPTTEVEVIYDIEYGNAKGIPLLLDIYIPEKPIVTPMPAIVWIHGGSWRAGDKTWASAPHFKSLAEHGFLMVSINYRLSGVAKFPAQVEDCKCAVRWLRANAEKYNVDPDRISVWGCSYYGPADFVRMYQSAEELFGSITETGPFAPVLEFLGGHLQEELDIYQAASPINHVTADDPPLLLVHGDSDQTVTFSHSEIMYEAYQQAGLEATLIKVTGAGHGTADAYFQQVTSSPISPSINEIEQIVLVFFIQHLLGIK